MWKYSWVIAEEHLIPIVPFFLAETQMYLIEMLSGKYVGRGFDTWKRQTYLEYLRVLSRSCWISQRLIFKKISGGASQVQLCVKFTPLLLVHLTSKGRRKRLKRDETFFFLFVHTAHVHYREKVWKHLEFFLKIIGNIFLLYERIIKSKLYRHI